MGGVSVVLNRGLDVRVRTTMPKKATMPLIMALQTLTTPFIIAIQMAPTVWNRLVIYEVICKYRVRQRAREG